MSALESLTAKPFAPAGAAAVAVPAVAAPAAGGVSALLAKPFAAPKVASPVEALTSSPYFQGKEPSGTFIGISDQNDPYSNRPYLAYRVPGATATTTDYTRTAPKVNPEAAAPTARDTFTNSRLPETASHAIRVAQGATATQQLDHRMALALGGSNNDANLKLIPTAENQAAGKGEGSLSADVAAGKLSLFQAQAQEAKNKGLPTPFTDENTPPAKVGVLQQLSDAPDDSLLGVFRNTVLGLPAAVETIGKATASTVAGVAKGIVKSYTNPSPYEQMLESQLPAGSKLAPENGGPLTKAILRTVVPMIEPFINDATASIIFNNPDLTQTFLKNANALVDQENASFGSDDVAGLSAAQAKLQPFSDVHAALNKTTPQIIGDTAQAVLGAYFPEMFGESMAAFAAKGLLPAIGTTAAHGAAAGFTFGVAQAASSGSTDPKELAGIIVQSTIAGTMLSLGTAAVLHGGIKTSDTLGPIIKDRTAQLVDMAKEGFKTPPRGFIKNPFAPDEEVPKENGNKSGSVEAPKQETSTLYHGTDVGSAATIEKGGFKATEDGMNRGNGISLTEDKNIANMFAEKDGSTGKVLSVKLSPEAKLVSSDEFIKTKNAIGEKSGFDTATQKTIDQYKAQGFDGVDFRKGKGGVPDALRNEVRVWNPDKIAVAEAQPNEKAEPQSKKTTPTKLNTGDPLVDTAARAKTPEEFYKNLTPSGLGQVMHLVDPDHLTYTEREAAHAFYRDVHEKVLPADEGMSHISKTKPSGKYVDSKTTENNGGVPPPENKGGLQAPEIDWSKGKDIAAIRLSTDTMERNIEKMFPKQEAKEINSFLVEKVRTNETNRVSFVSDLRTRIRSEVVDKLGIKPRTKLSALTQQFGEGRISLDELKKEAPTKYEDVGKAAAYFRNEYDTLLNKWNKARADAGLNPISKRQNYFRHFVELSEFSKNFGFDFRESNLPTAISGITEFFKSQTPWAGAALRRFGSYTTDDAVSGMDNYLDTASRAIFHTDSVQRGRLLEKYLRESATENTNVRADLMDSKSDKEAPPLIDMPNFASNLNDWVNLVSGKQARLDRAVESVVGRKALAVMRTITRRFGLNVIGGNISSAVTHAIPISYTLATVDKGAAFRGALDIVQAPFAADFNSISGNKSAFLTRRFGTESIYPSVTDRIAGGLSAPFHWVDQFISRFTVASKYFEKVKDGFDPAAAMREADNYAARVIGDRSTGNLPNLMNTKTLGWLTQFQIEVNDNIKVLIHDIPKWESEKDSKIPVTARVASRIVQFAFFSYLFNQLMQGMKGSGKGLDPIDMGLTLAGLNDEGHDKTLMDRLSAVGGDLLKELPFTSLPTQGQIPALQPLIKAGTALASGDVWGTLKPLLESFASPVGGGIQLDKTLTGIQAWRQGYLTDAAGKVIATVPPTIPALIQGAAFGANAFSSVKQSKGEIKNLDAAIKQQQAAGKLKDAQAANILVQLRGMPADQAKQQLLTIAQQDPDMAKRVLTAAKTAAAGITKVDTLIKSLGISNGARATYIVQKLNDLKTNEEKKAYLADLATKKLLTAAVLAQVATILKQH